MLSTSVATLLPLSTLQASPGCVFGFDEALLGRDAGEMIIIANQTGRVFALTRSSQILM
jgi:hypothetical protein